MLVMVVEMVSVDVIIGLLMSSLNVMFMVVVIRLLLMIDYGCVSGLVGIVNSSMVEVFIGVISNGISVEVFGIIFIIVLVKRMLMRVLMVEWMCLF